MTSATDTSAPTLEQRRAKHAWEAVQRVVQAMQNGTEGDKAKARDFGGQAKRLPMRIMAAGLGQALTFLLAKKYAPSLLEQRLRGRSHPLQSWRCELSALEDEAPLELPPRASLLKPFTFHNQIRDETSRNRMGLCAFLGGGLGLPGAGVPSLTGLEAQLALQHLDHFFHLMPFPVQPAHLVGG